MTIKLSVLDVGYTKDEALSIKNTWKLFGAKYIKIKRVRLKRSIYKNAYSYHVIGQHPDDIKKYYR